jgi:hypothetical protein
VAAAAGGGRVGVARGGEGWRGGGVTGVECSRPQESRVV